MRSFDILSDQTVIFGNKFLEASAGTGKTFTIEHLVVRLLKEGGLTLDQILVVTFTRAATRELKMRIRKQVGNIEDAHIFTIHGFCQKMLQEFALEAGVDFAYEEWTLEKQREKLRQFLRKKPWKSEELSALLEKYHSNMEDLSRAILAGEELVDEWKEERKKISLSSPDDILKQMEEALANPRFVQQVQQKYKAVIVDEFQDTDPIQWTIFKTLFLEANLSAFYLVGDPKQSIYAFRKADIYTFLKARDHFKEIHSLQINYRSEPDLLAALNELFCKDDWIDLPALGKTLTVPKVQPGKTGSSGKLSFFLAEGHLGRGRKWPTLEMEEEYFFPFIAQEIEKPEETAVLVKDRYQAERVKEFLQRWEIPCTVKRGALLAQTPAFTTFRDVLMAAIHPYDVSLVKKALYGKWIHQTWSEEGADLFVRLHEILREMGFAAFYAEFIKQFRVIETFDLNAIAEKLMDEKHIDRLMFSFDLLGTEEEEIPRGHHDGVQIMTVHASKGLEFDTVFALGLASRTYEKNENPQEHDAEKMRQLYVAMTRAKRRLFVPIARDLDGKELKPGQASPIELFIEKTAPDLSQAVGLNNTAFRLKKYTRPIISSPPLPPIVQTPPLWLRSFSALSQKTPAEISPPAEILPPGAETGVIIHTIFEKVFETPSIERLIQEEVKGTHLEGWEVAIQEMVEKTLSLPLDGFTLREVPVKKMFHELEFVFPYAGGMLKGFIDLCFEHQGKYYFLDWKTNWIEEYSQDHLKKAMQQGDYFLQAGIYATALKRYLKDTPFGGTFYIFVRGPAAYPFYPEDFDG